MLLPPLLLRVLALPLALPLVLFCMSGCAGGRTTSAEGELDSAEPSGNVVLVFTPAKGDVPADAATLDLYFLEDGNTIFSSLDVPKSSPVLVQQVPVRTDQAHVMARDGSRRVIAEGYEPLTVTKGGTTSVKTELVARSCRAPDAVAKELINMLSVVTVIAGGDKTISDEEWETYVPSPPFSKNSDRHLMFGDSCFYRTWANSWDCQGEDCYSYVPHDGHSWLRLARTEHLETMPASENTDRVPPPGYVQIIVLDKCHELVFEGQIWEMHDPYGNVYVMHANPDGQPDTTGPTLPAGWHIETRVLSQPLVLNPRGQSCRYTLIKDDQDQAYHQYVFDGLAGLSAAVSPECAALLDEN